MRKVIVLTGVVAVAVLASTTLPSLAENQPSTPPSTAGKAKTNADAKTKANTSGNSGMNTTGGASSVIVEGKPAMRAGDANDPGSVEIIPDVLIEGKPAVVCKNGTKSGSASVFIRGKPLARAGDCK
jgi:uncharacterized Zn-binding protein involved in type VI secretion